MADYYINSDKGKELANSLRAGDMAEASDGSTWRKEADGSITVTKNGQTMTGRVGVSAPAVSETASSGSTSVSTPVLEESQSQQSSPLQTETQLQTTELEKAQGQQPAQKTEELSASEKAKEATSNVTAGLGQSMSDDLLNQAIQQAMKPETYTIGSAKGVLMTEKMQKAGDMAEAADGSLWKRNEDGSITVTKDGKTYTANVDRAAAKQDPQWAVLTAPPEDTTDDTSSKKSKKKSSGSSSGASAGGGNYYATVPQTATEETTVQQAATADRATLRKQAATAQKEMGDLARQISVAKIRGKDTSDLQAQYNAAKARYDSATTQINATQKLTTTAARKEAAAEKNAAAHENASAVYEAESIRNGLSTETAREEKVSQRAEQQIAENARKREERAEPKKIATTRKELLDLSNQIQVGRARGVDTSALEAQYNGLNVYLEGLEAARAYNKATQNETSTQPTDGRVSEQEFSRSPAMVQQYGTYQNYLKAARQNQVATVEPKRDSSLGGKLFTMLSAGLGQFNSSVASFADTAATAVETVESYLTGGFTKDGKYVKGDSAFTKSLLQPIHDWANYTRNTSNALNEQSARNWDQTAAGSVANTIGTGVIAALPQAALALMTLGTSSAGALTQTSAGLAGSIETAIQRISNDPSFWLSFMQETGGNFAEAKSAGATDEQAILSATIAGLANAAIEVGGGLENNGWMNDSTLSKLRKAKNLIKGAVEEGGEELIQNPISRAMQKLVYDGDRQWLSFDNTAEGRDAVFNPFQSAEEFATGAAVGGILGAGNLALSRALNSRSQSQTQNTQLSQDEILDASIQAAMRGETLAEPLQAANQTTQQTMQGTAERGAEGVITGGQLNIDNTANRGYANNSEGGQAYGRTNQLDGASGEGVWGRSDGDGLGSSLAGRVQRNGRGNLSESGIVLLSPESQRILTERGIVNVELHDSSADNAAFSYALAAARTADQSNGWAVTPKSVQELKESGARSYMDTNGSTGFAIAPDGDIEAVFANKAAGAPKGSTKSTIPQAVALGGNKLDCYGHNLVDIYSKYGFEPVARVAFNQEYANDGWTADKGSPDIYFMMHNGDSADAVVQNMNKYKRWSKAELDALPLMDYDSAYQYRDFLLNKSIQRKTENDMGAMRSQFKSVPKQSQTQSNTIGSMEADWNVPESQRTPILYDTISEEKSLDNARLRLAQDYAGEMAELREKHNWSGEEVDMGMTILDNYRRAAEQTGDWTEYSNWRKEVSAHGTAAGQALQAYAKYSRQTGGGIVADASAALERAAKKTNKAEIMNRVSALAQQYDAAVGTGQENAKVNVNDLVSIIKDASTVRQTGTLIGNKTPPIVNWAMNRIANYARSEAQTGGGKNLDFLKTFAADSIYNIAADTREVSAGEQVKTVRRMGMLSKVSSVMRNLVSNNVFDPIDSIARNVSVPLDMLVSTITGTRSVAGDASWFSSAKRKGSMDGLARACMEVGLDVDASGTAGKYENTANRTFKMSGGVFSKLMSVWEAYEGYTLHATDEFQKGGIESSVQKGIDRLYEKGKITDDSLRNAGEQEALYRTFQDKTVLSDAAIGVRNALNKAHIGDVGAGDIVLPFAQVPSNLGARAIEYSPAGLIVAATDFVNMVNSAKNGELTAAQQAKAVQGVGRALTGSGMIAIAAAGALRGWLKVTGDDEDKNKDALSKTFGLDGTQLNISAALRDIRGEGAEWRDGDQLLSIGFLDPLNAQLTTGALIADDIRSEEGVTAGRVLGNSLSGALQSVLDTPVMSTFKDVATNYEYSTASTPGGKVLDAAQKYAANQLSSVIPNSLRGIAQGLDDIERNAYSSDNVWQQAIDNAKASIPGLRETLPAKTDVWGNPVKNEGGVRNFLNRNINPGNITTYRTDAVSNEITKISEATNTSLYPDRTAPRSLKVDGESVTLTFEQRSMYQKAYGDAYASAVSSLMNDKNYKAMPDSMKAEILKQAKDTATEQARDSLGIGYEMKASAQKILETSGADRNNAMIAAAVKAQHYMSDDTKKQLSDVEKQFGGADYIGLSEELINSAKEKVSDYYSKVEAAKYGGELTETQKELADKDSKELARYFMDEAINDRFKSSDGETKFDKVLDAYEKNDLNDTLALAVLSDDAVQAYDRYGRSAGVTPEMMLMASNAKANIKEETDEDGKVTNSAKDQFDAWLDKQWLPGTMTRWTDDQKDAVRMAFYKDASKTYSYLSDQLHKGNINTSAAKSELSTTYQSGWTHNVKGTGAKMVDYVDAIVEYENRPSSEELDDAGYSYVWQWFCDYLNTTDLTREQKYAMAISIKKNDYAEGTMKKIWNRLR